MGAGAKEYAVLMRLAGGNRFAEQELWLRKGRNHTEAPPSAGASAPKAAQQVAGRRPKPAPARAQAVPRPASAQAQAVPKPATAAQLARRERSQERLRQIPFKVCLSVVDHAGYTDNIAKDWIEYKPTGRSNEANVLVQITFDDDERISHVGYTDHLHDAFEPAGTDT